MCMKTPLIPVAAVLLLIAAFTISCNEKPVLKTYASDTIDVYRRLSPNENWISSSNTYGINHVAGHSNTYRITTDSNNVYVDFDVTLLELHPKITANLLSFMHWTMLHYGFADEKDTVPPFDVYEMTNEGAEQYEIAHRMMDWESELFYEILPKIEGERGYNLDVKIYPVFLNDDYVTYRKYAYYYTGGAHGNYTSLLQTFRLDTGETLDLPDFVNPEYYKELRKIVASHMASSHPIYDGITSVDQYLDSLNRWRSETDFWAFTRDDDDESDRITLENYPMTDPGIDETGLVFTYDKYALTPGSEGCPVIVVTYDEVRKYLMPAFKNYKTIMPAYNTVSEDLESTDWWISSEEIDSIRKSWGMNDYGKPFPYTVYDAYLFRHGTPKKHYDVSRLYGTWVGYGHLYDPRHFLTINPDGTYTDVTEEALNKDASGEMRYVYSSTVKGKYVYDKSRNKLTFLNRKHMHEISRNDFIIYSHPEHTERIIHSVKRRAMDWSDEDGDLWYYQRVSNP